MSSPASNILIDVGPAMCAAAAEHFVKYGIDRIGMLAFLCQVHSDVFSDAILITHEQ
jgi:hypothetical protein